MNAEARTSIDTLLTTLREQLAQPGQSLLPLLGVMSRRMKYSLANQMLIFAQRPDATRVQGYRAWQKAGYQVRKGEHGIAIYAPVRFTREDPDTLEPHSRTGFRVAYVFDLAQVERIAGTSTPSIDAPLSPTAPPRTAHSKPSRPSSSTTTSSSRTSCSPRDSWATPTVAASPYV